MPPRCSRACIYLVLTAFPNMPPTCKIDDPKKESSSLVQVRPPQGTSHAGQQVESVLQVVIESVMHGIPVTVSGGTASSLAKTNLVASSMHLASAFCAHSNALLSPKPWHGPSTLWRKTL